MATVSASQPISTLTPPSSSHGQHGWDYHVPADSEVCGMRLQVTLIDFFTIFEALDIARSDLAEQVGWHEANKQQLFRTSL